MDKWCAYCNQILPSDEFYKSSPRKCKACKLKGVPHPCTTQKWCDYCSTLWPATIEFWDLSPDKLKPHGRRCRRCRKTFCKSLYALNKEKRLADGERRRVERRRKIFDYLLQHPCVDCGEGDPIVLHFDHVRGEKILSVSVMVARNFIWNKVEKEIAKCVIRCANCHARKTARDFGWYASLTP